MLLKLVGFGVNSDGTYSMYIVPLNEPKAGQTLKEANLEPGSRPRQYGVTQILQQFLSDGFTLKAELPNSALKEPKVGQSIILG